MNFYEASQKGLLTAEEVANAFCGTVGHVWDTHPVSRKPVFFVFGPIGNYANLHFAADFCDDGSMFFNIGYFPYWQVDIKTTDASAYFYKDGRRTGHWNDLSDERRIMGALAHLSKGREDYWPNLRVAP